jgi:3-deoxy-7-phosphoheptulonate synthase
MILEVVANIREESVEELLDTLKTFGLAGNVVRTERACYIVTVGTLKVDLRSIGSLPQVRDVFVVPYPYQLVCRDWKVTPSSIELPHGHVIGSGELSLMMGPCSLETPEQVDSILNELSSLSVPIMRGGAFKPRSSPYSFRGLGIEGLSMCYERAHARGIAVVSEVMEPSQIDAMEPFVDIYQVGTRNAQNFNLLHELGRSRKPVLIKRGMSGTLEELLYAAEYIYAGGNEKIILCERGIRTFEKSYRNTLDLNAIPFLKERSHLPIAVDPSHGVGIRRYVEAMSLAAVAAGADALLVEIHPRPEEALSDGDQTLNYSEAHSLVARCRVLAKEIRDFQ